MLILDGVTSGYDTTTVLRDVHLVVPPGAVVALLGPNGAGKTTLLRTVSGLVRSRTGRILLGGEDVGGLAPAERTRRGLCLIPEGRGVFPPLTVRENLVLFSPREADQADILDRAVDAFPALGSRLRQPAGTLSGGQQQMLALTRAYVAGARLILLDEVSLGLAPIVVDEIFGFIGSLAGRGLSLLIVEQYVQKALAVADYVYILRRGEVAFAGDAGELADDDVFTRYLGATDGSGARAGTSTPPAPRRNPAGPPTPTRPVPSS